MSLKIEIIFSKIREISERQTTSKVTGIVGPLAAPPFKRKGCKQTRLILFRPEDSAAAIEIVTKTWVDRLIDFVWMPRRKITTADRPAG